VGNASAISHGHDQQRDGAQSLRPIDQVLRCRGTAPRRDVVVVAPGQHALTIEPQLGSPLDPDRLSKTLSTLAGKYEVPGAQLAIHHGGETVVVEVGELEYGTGHAVTRDAAFPIGSITKTFTATVAMILVADGDLELDAPLGEHVAKLGDLGNELTLRQLLSHTSGLANAPGTDVHTSSIRRYVLDHCCRQNLVLPPGTGFSYSNIGYVLVGHLIETVTGMSWWEAVESILLLPLRIEPMGIGASDHRPLATGHSVNMAVGRTRPVEQSLAPAEAPAGGLAMSAADLVNLGLTQFNSALLPAAYAEQMRQAVPMAEPPWGWADGWGLGLAVFGTGDTAWVGHFGACVGTSCEVRLDPVSGCIVAFTSNAKRGGMWYELIGELRRAGLPIKDCSDTKVRGRPTVAPSGCAGRYQNGKAEWSISVTETGALSLAIAGDVVAEFICFEDLSFFAPAQPNIRGRFLRDPISGEIDGIQYGLYVVRRQSVARGNGRYSYRPAPVGAH
jgi:CubicO group peptidase (beta-lactamase class C family)